jgi:hypothetical protein
LEGIQRTFPRHFGEIDPSVTSANAIRRLKQGKRPVSVYAAEFRRLASDLNWNDDALISQFMSGLNEELNDFLVHYDLPETVGEMVNLAIKCDNRIFERKKARQMARNDKNDYAFYKDFTAGKSKNDDMMDLDATTMNERSTLMKNGQCFFCKEKGHLKQNCPKLKKDFHEGQ